MLKAPDHQVAGHQALDGHLGPLVDDSGCFYKPLQNDERGSKEVAFYEKFISLTGIPSRIRRFFPIFHGTKNLEASDGTGMHPHLILEDVVFGCMKPCITDIKIGSRTWYPGASEDYFQKCISKDGNSTSVSLGFRVSGLQVYGSKESDFWKPNKKIVKSFTPEDVRLVLRRFVSSDVVPGIDKDVTPDCSLASRVYGGSSGVLAQLSELKEWFEDQTMFHFNSCSVLILYEKDLALRGKSGGAEVKLVDFAHVVDGNGVIDHNFLGGLCSLKKFISDILTDTNKPLSEACLPEMDTSADGL
ncbi:inositol polyphosphate multikinase beta-like [Punica granatum]|uniref:Inositol polyphosphate multikinase n=2 Tax=Punica granatum TaxID=22663 RepID=A0A218X3L8_PUNGR|nr:inositol polyphosphate multikinase beta-like [Punica granatum]OWM79286.1 hypothetical protein CDL15_Pgr003458 [Punica granatum]PKI50250.1 hypothetical protein CRG98_029323 [Punica granatum]